MQKKIKATWVIRVVGFQPMGWSKKVPTRPYTTPHGNPPTWMSLKKSLPNRKVVFQPPFFRGELLNFGGVVSGLFHPNISHL